MWTINNYGEMVWVADHEYTMTTGSTYSYTTYEESYVVSHDTWSGWKDLFDLPLKKKCIFDE